MTAPVPPVAASPLLQRLSILAGAAALIAVLIAVFIWPGESQQGHAQATETSAIVPTEVVATHQNHHAGMRIIHVPDAGAGDDYPPQPYPQLDIESVAEPKANPERIAMPKPRPMPPSATEPKRTIMSPPPPNANSLTPIRPTPRWRLIEKSTIPPKQKTSAPTTTETVAPVKPTETAAAPAPAERPDIKDDASPPTD